MKILSQIFILFIFVSCAGEVKTTSEIPQQRDSTLLTSNDSVSSSDTTEEEIAFETGWENWKCKAIKYPSFDSSLYLNAPFNSVKALHLLFAGNLYEYRRGEYFCEWISTVERRKKFKNDFNEDEYFPYKTGNETKVIDTIYYSLLKKEYVLVSFSTREFSTDEIGTGRYSGAVLGLALFEKNDKRWQLKAFNPAVTFNGKYQQADAPDLVKISPTEEAFESVSKNGGPGDPFTGSLELIIRDGSSFSIAFVQPYACWINDRFSGWHQEISYTDNGDLFVVLKGEYSMNGFKDWDKEFIPDFIEEMSKRKDSTTFTYTYFYKRDSTKFSLVNQSYVFK